jgi:hypothetical protein
MESVEALFRIQGEKLFQEPRSLGTGPGERGIDRSKDGRESLGPVEIEEPASYLPATWADGEQMKELLVLLHGSIHGEPALQGGGIEVLVLHGFLLGIFLSGRIIAHLEDENYRETKGPGVHPTARSTNRRDQGWSRCRSGAGGGSGVGCRVAFVGIETRTCLRPESGEEVADLGQDTCDGDRTLGG